jgi:hypothetical protein
MPKVHHRLSPSKAHRWLVCPGSLQHESDGGRSSYAEEGQHAHEILEAILTGIPVLTGDIIGGKPASTERISQAIEVRDFLKQWKTQHPDFVVETETPLNISRGVGHLDTTDFDGTADAIAWNAKELVVLDAKFGFVRVEPENNPQLYLYAIGALTEIQDLLGLRPENLCLIIAQPNYEGVMEFREHRMTFKDLNTWFFDNIAAIALAYRGDKTLNASSEKACRFCPGRVACPARLEAWQNFALDTWYEAHSLDEMLPHVERVRRICDDLERAAVTRLSEGHEVKGFKLVESRSIRKWQAIPNLEQLLSSDTRAPIDGMTEKKLLSPAQMEKYILRTTQLDKWEVKAAVNKLAMVPRGGPKLAPESDPRPKFEPEGFTQEDVDKAQEGE